MPYIGNPIYQSAFVTDTFSGNGTTTAFTMSVAPAGVTNVLVAVSGVLQDPATYGVVGTTLNFSAAPPSGTGNISVRYLGVPATGVTTTAYRTVTEFTATAGQTTFTPPSYTVGFIDVYRNGVMLGSADYTATNGTTVVLTNPATAGDLVETISFLVSSVLNALPLSGGNLSGNLNLTAGNLGFTGTAQRIRGDFSNATVANRVILQTSTTDGSTFFAGIPNGTGVATVYDIYNNSDVANGAFGRFSVDSSTVTINSSRAGTGTFLPITFRTSNSERLRIDTSGNVGIGTSSPSYKLDVIGQASRLGSGSTGSVFGLVNNTGGNLYFGLDQSTGDGLASGSSAYAGVLSHTGAYSLQFATNNTVRATIDSSGNLLVGAGTGGGFTIFPNYSRAGSTAAIVNHISGSASGESYFQFQLNGTGIGSITQNGTTNVAYNTSSDYRLKENIAPMTGALSLVQQLKPVTYNWKSDGSDGQGFIAHELQAIVPDCVTGEKDAMRTEKYEISPAIPATFDEEGNELTPAVEAVMGEREVPAYQGIDTSFLVATLTAAIQELKAELDSVKAELATLKGSL